MSQIAALLLMYLMEEEDAFWGLHQLMNNSKYAMHGFFIHGFPKLMRFQAHHDKVMRKFLPRLKKHLDKQGIDSGIYTLKWFFQCFLDRVSCLFFLTQAFESLKYFSFSWPFKCFRNFRPNTNHQF